MRPERGDMLYKENSTHKLNFTLFKDPSAAYRGVPFWGWNGTLDKEELMWQLDNLKKMGFGGAFLHVRTGLDIPYLGDEYMEYIRACVRKAEEEGMQIWLYDEDRWPSGAAGGLVTKEKKYRATHLLFTSVPYGEAGELKQEGIVLSTVKAVRTENGRLLACYDIQLDSTGRLISSKRIEAQETAKYEKWYAYSEQNRESPWYNNKDYVNTLDKEALNQFIDITHEAYSRAFREKFGNIIPAIFTDEPQIPRKITLSSALNKEDIMMPWVDDLPDSFSAAYPGEQLMEALPELIWERSDGHTSLVRYHYHDHICERFTEAFMDNCGDWCTRHGFGLTGHMIGEESLYGQTFALGEVMRTYRRMLFPGMDSLCAKFEFNTAKQVQSVVHQYGREAMLGEMYGVTNWDFDFRDYKLHGDWQAALGVTIRVPHHALMSLAGESKRDYPASINHQSPWWEKYELVETHFARVNTALTRGKPDVRIGVIHPIESYWLHWGPEDQTGTVRKSLEQDFKNITEWLLFGGIDFDFVSEALLPELCSRGSNPLQIGEMAYDMILVSNCETLRSFTWKCLTEFAENGGKLLFTGNIPYMIDACPDIRTKELVEKGQYVLMNRSALLEAAEPIRQVEIREKSGTLTNNLLYQLRQDVEGCWLFIAHGSEPYNKDISRFQDLNIKVKGKWKATIYDTIAGNTREAEYITHEERTEIFYRLYDYDSLLLWLEPSRDESTLNYNDSDKLLSNSVNKSGGNSYPCVTVGREISIPALVSYSLSEPNVLMLDQAEYSLDNGEWKAREEVLRIDEICRMELGWPSKKKHVAQPWVLEKGKEEHTLRLRWTISSFITCEQIYLAIEDPDNLQIIWNGEAVTTKVTGWYTDKAIKKILLPALRVGDNILEVSIPYGNRTNVEWAYLLGDFGVELRGRNAYITELKSEIAFGDYTAQGLPFYGGNITYYIPVKTVKKGLIFQSGQYRGALQEVSIDGGQIVPVIYPPYAVQFDDLEAGEHILSLTLYGNRRNGFGPVHLSDLKETWIAPTAWRTEGERWCYEYQISKAGVLISPKLTES